MKIKEGDCFPQVDFYMMSDKGPVSVKSTELFNDKKILLVSVPGAFTPTCSEQHLPGYIKHKDDIISKGIDKIFFVYGFSIVVLFFKYKLYNDNILNPYT